MKNENSKTEMPPMSIGHPKLKFTFDVDGKRNKFFEVQASVDDKRMKVNLYSIENYYGGSLLSKDNEKQLKFFPFGEMFIILPLSHQKMKNTFGSSKKSNRIEG